MNSVNVWEHSISSTVTVSHRPIIHKPNQLSNSLFTNSWFSPRGFHLIRQNLPCPRFTLIFRYVAPAHAIKSKLLTNFLSTRVSFREHYQGYCFLSPFVYLKNRTLSDIMKRKNHIFRRLRICSCMHQLCLLKFNQINVSITRFLLSRDKADAAFKVFYFSVSSFNKRIHKRVLEVSRTTPLPFFCSVSLDFPLIFKSINNSRLVCLHYK